MRGFAAFTFLLAGGAAVWGQQQTQPPGSTGRSTTNTTPCGDSTGIGNMGSTMPGGCGSGPEIQRPIFISGKVVLGDGTVPPEPVSLERVCNGAPRLEGYSDRKGHFSFELGRNSMAMQDASSGGQDGFDSPIPGARGSRNSGSGRSLGGTGLDPRLMGCELRAALPGFRSDVIMLSNIRPLDNPDVGIIVLHRLGNVDGLTISATSGLAPKDARKAFEKALEANTKKKPEEAKAALEKAVELYPRYASAWFELGKLHEQRDEIADARKAYNQSLVADSKYIQPLQRMAWLTLKDSDWTGMEGFTAKLLSLDPLNYPDMYYLNGVANLQLKHFDVAEKSTREAIRLDPAKKNVRSYYVLGLVQASKEDFLASAESLRTFLAASPNAADAEAIRKQLTVVELNAVMKADETKSAAEKSNP